MTARPEFSFVVDLRDFGRSAKQFHLSADEAERRRVAARLGAIGVERLDAGMTVSATPRMIAVDGTINAVLTRECVASLEPMREDVAESFRIEFLRQADAALAEDDWDGPDLHEGDELDLGELLIQQVSLAMAAFPRKNGVESLADVYGTEQSDSPFADLQRTIGKKHL